MKTAAAGCRLFWRRRPRRIGQAPGSLGSIGAALGLLLGSPLAHAQDPMAEYRILVQEAALRAKPAVALVTARVDAEATLDCGAGPVTVTPAPYVETGTGWFVDARGYVVTNGHVVDPAHRLPAEPPRPDPISKAGIEGLRDELDAIKAGLDGIRKELEALRRQQPR